MFRGLLACGLAGVLLATSLLPDEADARRKRRRHVQPPLRILSIVMTPESYNVGNGSLEITVDVKLPPDLDGATVLEVSSLITSPSKRHLRFLRSRKPIDLHFEDHANRDGANPDHGEADATPPPPTRPDQVSVTLRWDGTDQYQALVPEGRYDYVIRAKLLTLEGEDLRTHMVSWKKLGSVRVKPALPPEPETGETPEASEASEANGGEEAPPEADASAP